MFVPDDCGEENKYGSQSLSLLPSSKNQKGDNYRNICIDIVVHISNHDNILSSSSPTNAKKNHSNKQHTFNNSTISTAVQSVHPPVSTETVDYSFYTCKKYPTMRTTTNKTIITTVVVVLRVIHRS